MPSLHQPLPCRQSAAVTTCGGHPRLKYPRLRKARLAAWPWGRLCRRHLRASGPTPAPQDVAAARGAHPRHESVNALPAPLLGLPSTLNQARDLLSLLASRPTARHDQALLPDTPRHWLTSKHHRIIRRPGRRCQTAVERSALRARAPPARSEATPPRGTPPASPIARAARAAAPRKGSRCRRRRRRTTGRPC